VEWHIQRSRTGFLIHDAALCTIPEPWIFDPLALRQHGLATGSGDDGRGQVVFFQAPAPEAGGEWVLRHYLRGGAVARLLGDRYLWIGTPRSRPWREFLLTAQMCNAGLPVPRPVAARLQRTGPYYRADLITRRIADAETLDARLRQAPVAAEAWYAIGACIRRFHAAGYCHADLNSRNILIDAQHRIWVLDWDRGRQRDPGTWGEGNLERLHRDLRKRLRMSHPWHFSSADFARLRAGYQGLPVASEAGVAGG
jgi:3-deoxy-D-manno-octulosonic acid kinase